MAIKELTQLHGLKNHEININYHKMVDTLNDMNVDTGELIPKYYLKRSSKYYTEKEMTYVLTEYFRDLIDNDLISMEVNFKPCNYNYNLKDNTYNINFYFNKDESYYAVDLIENDVILKTITFTHTNFLAKNKQIDLNITFDSMTVYNDIYTIYGIVIELLCFTFSD